MRLLSKGYFITKANSLDKMTANDRHGIVMIECAVPVRHLPLCKAWSENQFDESYDMKYGKVLRGNTT